MSCFSPSSVMIWQFWNSSERSRDSLCQPQLFRAQPNLFHTVGCIITIMWQQTVHLHLLQRSLTIPQRDPALKKQSAQGIAHGSLWATGFRKGKMMPPDGSCGQRKGKVKDRREGRTIRNRKGESKTGPGRGGCSCDQRRENTRKCEIKTTAPCAFQSE